MNEIIQVKNETTGTIWSLEKIYSIINEIVEILRVHHGFEPRKIISVKINPRLSRALGRTTIVGDGIYELDFNYNYLKYGTDENIKSTIAHEVIHTIPGCWNHKNKFKAAGIILSAYNYSITRCKTDIKYMNFLADKNKSKISYTCTCLECGYEVERERWCKMLENMSNPNSKIKYICPDCKKMEWKVIKNFPNYPPQQVVTIKL